MSKFRVMIVDDEVRTRRCLNDLISSQLTDFEVVAVTSSMATALARLEHSATDFLIVDFALIEDDSSVLIQEILKKWSGLSILSYRTPQSGILKKIQAIHQGSERVQVIDTTPEPENISTEIVQQLIKSTRSLRTIRTFEQKSNVAPRDSSIFSSHESQKRPSLIVIGVSTGGPNALAEVIPLLPASLAVPILIVQHMPASFIQPLAERLTSLGKLNVQVAQHGEKLSGSICRIAPGERHLEVALSNNSLVSQLVDTPPENSCKPAADVLFRSSAKALGSDVLGVVLTGMGRDGCAGSKSIREAGGSIIVQDEKSSVVWGMPGSVVEANLANKVLPLHEIAPEIIRRCQFIKPI